MVTHPDINPIQQGLTSVIRWELVFPFGDGRTSQHIGSVNNLRGAFSPNEGVITSEKERKGKEKTKVNRTHFCAKNMSI